MITGAAVDVRCGQQRRRREGAAFDGSGGNWRQTTADGGGSNRQTTVAAAMWTAARSMDGGGGGSGRRRQRGQRGGGGIYESDDVKGVGGHMGVISTNSHVCLHKLCLLCVRLQEFNSQGITTWAEGKKDKKYSSQRCVLQ
jgi:hypothetical protein